MQQGPEIGHAIGDRFRIVAVRCAARQRLLITLAGGDLPVLQTAPIELVELPHDAGAHGLKFLQRQPVLILRAPGIAAGQGAQQRGSQASRHHLAGVDMHVHDRHLVALFVVALGGDDHFAKVLFVLDPVEFDLEAGELGLLNVAFLQERVDGSNDVLGAGGRRFALEVIEFDNHISCESVEIIC